MRESLLTPILVCTLYCTLPGCNRSGTPIITTPTAAQVAEFVRNAGISLPPTAHPVGWVESRGMDDVLWLQVQMPAADIPAFLESSPFRGAKLATTDEYDLHHFQDFWKTPPQRYRSGQQRLPNARVLNIVIDDSDATNAVVYLMWHET